MVKGDISLNDNNQLSLRFINRTHGKNNSLPNRRHTRAIRDSVAKTTPFLVHWSARDKYDCHEFVSSSLRTGKRTCE